jgi:phosphate transport system substrate-binding protein
MAPVIQGAAELFGRKKPVKFQVEGKGSHGGIFALLDGRCDIAESSVPISDMEMELARVRNIEIREYIVAHDLVVPVVHPANPVSGLSVNNLRGIFNGVIKSWKEAGGKDLPIRLIVRDDKSGTKDVWGRMVTLSDNVAGIVVKSSNSAVLGEVAHDEGAIGYVSLSYINREVKALKVDGVAATIENGINGRYALKRSLYLYVNQKTLTREARDFVVFLLSREGQRHLRGSGFIPVSNIE